MRDYSNMKVASTPMTAKDVSYSFSPLFSQTRGWPPMTGSGLTAVSWAIRSIGTGRMAAEENFRRSPQFSVIECKSSQALQKPVSLLSIHETLKRIFAECPTIHLDYWSISPALGHNTLTKSRPASTYNRQRIYYHAFGVSTCDIGTYTKQKGGAQAHVYQQLPFCIASCCNGISIDASLSLFPNMIEIDIAYGDESVDYKDSMHKFAYVQAGSEALDRVWHTIAFWCYLSPQCFLLLRCKSSL